MDNQYRAAEEIYKAWLNPPRPTSNVIERSIPRHIAKSLNDAGLLMPDLPEPSEELIWYEDSGTRGDSFEVWVSDRHGTVEIAGLKTPQMHIPIERAEHFALSILAALAHNKQDKENTP